MTLINGVVRLIQFLSLLYRAIVPGQQRLCVSMDKALELSGDFFIKLFSIRPGSRREICRAQLNTSTLYDDRVVLDKKELDVAELGERSLLEIIVICLGAIIGR